MGKRQLVALLFLSSWCHVTVIVLCCLFLTGLWVCLQCMIVAFPVCDVAFSGHDHFLCKCLVCLHRVYKVSDDKKQIDFP